MRALWQRVSPTIAALATAPGLGAVSIIRLSGPEALAVVGRVFQPAQAGPWRPRTMRLGRIMAPGGRLLDEALAVWFPGPRSFTGEDCCEIQGHGGPVVSALALKAVLEAGAALAEPGEFTRRAFHLGRLDLSQAEAVAELVAARSEAEAWLAARQLAGGLSAQIAPIRQALFSALAELTAELDFGDDLAPQDMDDWRARLRADGLLPLEKLLADGRSGRPFREGLRLALAGAPNVGKSSLFNALIGADRALVSPVPGTTRDYITAEAVWAGLAVELCDTAGLSPAPVDDLDARGQERSQRQLAQADLALWVRDCAAEAQGVADFEPPSLPPGRTLTVWNKIDLAGPPESGGEALAVSARTGQGLPELKAAILKLATGRENPAPPEVAPNLRHQAALARTAQYLRAVLAASEAGHPPDIWALELKEALQALDIICGQTTPDDILKEIFSRFCLGK
ncbi:MAG: tRNA uridine-5-carboxymethylaminomethyl(34) synthesis GTPase MnmE [Candidatus Adiutrix sp.]|jgi:tRNA modification GTPase|nr:tRNA uridine-5-carboxymethylaminomethyl(34) synthesis GTPase MnmE [Candidatus Adiutrix sp.]